MSCLLYISELFHNFAVGIGALLAGIAGLIAAKEYFSAAKRKAFINAYKNKYPRNKLGEKGTFYLVHSSTPNQRDRIYILDKEAKERYWVKNPETLSALDFTFGDAIKNNDLFDAFPEEGELINFFK